MNFDINAPAYDPMTAFSSWGQPSANQATGMGANAINTTSVGYDPMAAFNQSASPQQPGATSWWNDPTIMGGKDAQGNVSNGILPTALGAASGIAGTVLGFEQLGLAEDQLKFNQDAFWSQYNQQVADREASTARQKASASGVSQYS